LKISRISKNIQKYRKILKMWKKNSRKNFEIFFEKKKSQKHFQQKIAKN